MKPMPPADIAAGLLLLLGRDIEGTNSSAAPDLAFKLAPKELETSDEGAKDAKGSDETVAVAEVVGAKVSKGLAVLIGAALEDELKPSQEVEGAKSSNAEAAAGVAGPEGALGAKSAKGSTDTDGAKPSPTDAAVGAKDGSKGSTPKGSGPKLEDTTEGAGEGRSRSSRSPSPAQLGCCFGAAMGTVRMLPRRPTAIPPSAVDDLGREACPDPLEVPVVSIFCLNGDIDLPLSGRLGLSGRGTPEAENGRLLERAGVESSLSSLSP